METSDLLIRIGLCAALGGAIGLEREISEHAAGFRTHVLVALGAGLFTLAGVHALAEFSGGGPIDPTRIAAQVVTGIGFLGAGAIIRQGVDIKGLTTAASLWVTAAVGTAVGLGYLLGAAVTTATALVALAVLKWMEDRLPRRGKGDQPDL